MALEIAERLQGPPIDVDITLTLPFELRQKSRLLTQLDSGAEARLFLPRGTILRHGDLLRAKNGLIIRVQAAPEELSKATTGDPVLLARACYHLGNRHAPMQVGPGWVCYARDHVLDDMLRALGLTVLEERAPFEPELGAYGNHGHNH